MLQVTIVRNECGGFGHRNHSGTHLINTSIVKHAIKIVITTIVR